MPADFEAFTRAVSAQAVQPSVVAPNVSKVAILGGAPDARLWAALSLASGLETILFSAYGRELEALRASSGIGIRGAGPVGTYHVDQGSHSVQLTAELDAAVSDADVIFLTGPVHKQRTYAMVLAEHLSDGQILVAPRAGTFGVFELNWMLRLGGCEAALTLIELHNAPHWVKADGTSLALSAAMPVRASVLQNAGSVQAEALTSMLPGLELCASALASAFSDLSAAVETPALVFGGPAMAPGGVSVPFGGVSLPENATFHALIGSDQMRLISLLAEERRHVAATFGVRGLPETSVWIDQYTGAAKGEAARPIPNREAARAIIRDGVLNSLVPLASAAAVAGIAVPQTEALIRLSEAAHGTEISAAGRRLETVGIPTQSLDCARRALELKHGGAL